MSDRIDSHNACLYNRKMSGSKSPDFDAYGLLRATHSHNPTQSSNIARMMLEEQALEYYFAQGKKNISLRGTAPMLIHYIDKYGAQPYDKIGRAHV